MRLHRRFLPNADAILGGRRAAAGLVVGIAALGLVVYLLLGAGSEVSLAPGPDDTSFYLEAEVVVLGPASDGIRAEEAYSTLQWWYVRRSLWRWRIDTDDGQEEPRTLIGVADGKYVWVHDSDTATYTRVSIKDRPSSELPSSVLLGAVDIAALTERWQAQGVNLNSGGAGRHLGREAQVIEYSPTWRSGGSGGELSGGIGRIWIDDETGLVLRNLVDGGVAYEYLDARVTLLELSPRVDRGMFRFEAPEGSNRVDAN
jgi:outer membrane lipoprotein-sorting protein